MARICTGLAKRHVVRPNSADSLLIRQAPRYAPSIAVYESTSGLEAPEPHPPHSFHHRTAFP